MANSFELPPLPSDIEDAYGVMYTADQMRAYARAAVEAEREACAKLCKDHQKMREETSHPREASTARKLAEMIRARGKS